MTTVFAASDNSPIEIESLQGTTVVVTIPAAFSGTCTEQCVPGILSALPQLKELGATQVIVVCSDQPFAINEWVKYSKWAEADVVFASDFGNFAMRDIVGKLRDEEGKNELPPCIGDLLRRGYFVFRDGKIVWKYIEEDTTKYTLNLPEMLSAIA